ncbi:MAG: BatD family protein [Pseudomonadota bacterium]|nr:BatD family protein [Pseudomonadota bacterium]
MNTNRNHGRWLIAIVSLLLVLAAPAIADDPLVYATIQPAQITLGESARFTITNLGDGAAPITMPVVSGLQFEIIGRTRQIEIINGTTLPSTSIVVRVTPQIAGIFSIPGVTPKSQPLVLQVNALPGSAGAPRSSSPQAPKPPPILAGGSIPKGVRLTEDGSAYVRLSVPKREVYVGESIPVEIELGMRSGFVTSLNGLPKLTGDDFTLNNLSHQPERSEKLIDGQAFVLLTWRSVLSVVKPGSFPLSAEVPLTVKIRTRPRRESALDDQFGDPFWQNFFGASVPKDINVQSPSQELKVLALPAEGRPADFHGAIGSFAIESDVLPAKADVGDPLTLRMRVVGSGNFDRVDSAMLDHVESWKTYPPKSTFNTNDPLRHKGEKVFEQPLIASKPGAQTLPALSFSYFDPNTKRYETTLSAPLSVTISPSLADSTLTAPQVAASGVSAAANMAAAGLKPDHVVAGSRVSSLIPPSLQPRFLAIPSLLALAFAGCWVGLRRRSNPTERVSARHRLAAKMNKRVIAQLEAVARAGNPAVFFNAARDALQQTLAVRWQVAPEKVTAAEVRDRLNADPDIEQLFALADESKYSDHDLRSTDFARWMRAVRRGLTDEATR